MEPKKLEELGYIERNCRMKKPWRYRSNRVIGETSGTKETGGAGRIRGTAG